MDAKIIAVRSQTCLRAGEQVSAYESTHSPSAYPRGDVNLYLFTEERQVWSYVRQLFRRARREGGANGTYMRRVARTLARGIDFADRLDGLEWADSDGAPEPISADDCIRLDS